MSGPPPNERPPHEPVPVPGVHGVADRISLRAGETFRLRTSASVPYRVTIRRPGTIVDDPSSDVVLHRFAGATARPLPIHPGSYVHVPVCPVGERSPEGTLESWIRPWAIDCTAGILTVRPDPAAGGFALVLEPGGGIAFHLTDSSGHAIALRSPPDAVATERWFHVAASWDSQEVVLRIDGRPRARTPTRWSPPVSGTGPLRIGADGRQGRAGAFLDADVARPAVRSVALTDAETVSLFEDRGLRFPVVRGLVAAWPLDEERGVVVRDGTGNGHDGTIVNRGTWGVGGPAFDAAVPRFGGYAPAADPHRGHGLRLASDDLDDCGWPVSETFPIPSSTRPGFHEARYEYELDGVPRSKGVTFVVRRASDRSPAPIVVVAASNTWFAYDATPFAEPPPGPWPVWGTHGVRDAPDDHPSWSFYHPHRAGQGTYTVSERLPCPAADVRVRYGPRTGYSHLVRAERFTHAWLERRGYAFDVISDADLDREPDILDGHRVVVLAGHSEYWTLPAYEALRRHLDDGGGLVVLSGNTLFWRVTRDDDTGILECRKVDAAGAQMPPWRRGEAWHALDGRRGGLFRDSAEAGFHLIGLDSLGFVSMDDATQYGPWFVEAADHPLFEGTGLRAGDPFGEGGRPSQAGGHEVDVTIDTIRRIQCEPSPPGGVLPDPPEGITVLARGRNWDERAVTFDWFGNPASKAEPLGAEMIWWDRPAGGHVFHAGAIGAGWSLEHDPRFGRIVRNALTRLGVDPEPAREDTPAAREKQYYSTK